MNTKTHLFAAAGLIVSTFAQISHGDDFPVSFSGFLSHGYIETSDYNYLVPSEEGSLDFVELGLNATWSPFDRATVRGQLFAFELGQYGNYDPIIDYLFLDYNVNQYLGLRLGRVKRPSGVYNDIQDIDVARTSILLPIAMYDQRYRDFSASVDGASLYGSISLGDNQSIDYNAFHGKIYLNVDGGIAAFGETSLGRQIPGIDITDIEGDIASGLQVWWNTPLSGLRIGGNYSDYSDTKLTAEGNIPLFFPMFAGAPFVSNSTVHSYLLKMSAEYYWNSWTFVAEYEDTLNVAIENRSIGGFPTPPVRDDSNSLSYYASVSKRFLEKFEAGVTYASYFGIRSLRSDPRRFNKDLQFSLRYDIRDYWTLKAEIHDIEGTVRLFNQLGQNPVLEANHWTLFALKSTYSF